MRLVPLLALLWLAPPARAEDYRRLGDEVVQSVRDHFYDGERARRWAAAHEGYGAPAADRAEFSRRTNAVLKDLGTSHTAYYLTVEPEYWMLRAIFQSRLLPGVRYDSAGADFARLPEGLFVRKVFAGGPAEKAGLLRGDRILSADGRPFDPYLSFAGRSGKTVALSVERSRGSAPAAVELAPRRVVLRKEWLRAQKAGSKVLDLSGRKVAYAPLWSCAGGEYREALEDAMGGAFRDAEALVLDLRDGWGGCGSDFMNLFLHHDPAPLTGGDPREPVWSKPVFLLVNAGTRSGKEMAAFRLKRRKLAVVIGERTAGAYLAGAPFLLSDKSLLYLPVSDASVDGVRLEGRGVEPDVAVADSLPYARGADPQLERALAAASKP